MPTQDAYAPAPEDTCAIDDTKDDAAVAEAPPEELIVAADAAVGAVAAPMPEDEHAPLSEEERLIVEMIEELPGGYVYLSERKLIHYMSGPFPVRLCGPLRVAAMLRDVSGASWSYAVEFLDRDGALRRHVIAAADLVQQPRRLVADLLGLGLDVRGSAHEMALYLKSLDPAERIRTTDRTGWIELPDQPQAYVLPDGAVVGRGGDRPITYTGQVAALASAGTLSGWQEGVGRLACGNPALMIAISAALTGPLLRLANIDTIGINFYASTTSGKTTTLQAALSVGQTPSDIHRWHATSTALELLATSARDGFLALDEFPYLPKDPVVAAAYAIGNGTGKGRGTADITLRVTDRFRTVLLSTSEDPIPVHLARARMEYPEGLGVRLIDVPVKSWTHSAFETLHGHAGGHGLAVAIGEAARAHHGHLLEAFVRRLVDNEAAHQNALPAVMSRFQAAALQPLGLDVASPSGPVLRVIDRIGLVVAAGTLAGKAGLLPWPAGSVQAAGLDILRLWHGARIVRTAGPAMVIQRIRDLLAASRFIDLNDPHAVPEAAAGWMDAQWLYIDSAVFAAEIALEDAPGRTAKILCDKGLLVPGGEQSSLQYKLPASLVPSRPRTYRIRRTRLAQM